MRDTGVRPIVFSSTCAVYGVPEKTPLDEGMPTRPINPYGESKLAFERALALVQRSSWVEGHCAALLQRRRRERTIWRAARAGNALDSACARRRSRPRARRSRSSATTIRRATAPASATTFTCSISPMRICWRCSAPDGPRMEIYNLGCGGDGYSIREVIDCADTGDGPVDSDGDEPAQARAIRPFLSRLRRRRDASSAGNLRGKAGDDYRVGLDVDDMRRK